MQGLHLTADLTGCPATVVLTDVAALKALCLGAVQSSGLQAVAELFHPFAPNSGITGVVLLAESHLAVHTWPELGGVTLDVYVCNYGQDNSSAAHALMEALIAAFAPTRAQREVLQRG